MSIKLIHEWRNLQFDSERKICWETFRGNFIYFLLEFLPEICWEEVAAEIFIDISFCFRCPIWGWNRVLTNKRDSFHYRCDGNFMSCKHSILCCSIRPLHQRRIAYYGFNTKKPAWPVIHLSNMCDSVVHFVYYNSHLARQIEFRIELGTWHSSF